MVSSYNPIWPELFEKYSYSWEDIDLKIYPEILMEEGFSKEEIDKEIEHIKMLWKE
jgi:hypothetical protein